MNYYMHWMKTTALILCAASAFAGVSAAPCNTTALTQLTMNENVRTCGTEAGYSLTSMAIPNDAQINAFCSSNACQESINAVKQVAPDECTIGSIRLYANVINPLSQRCGMTSGSNSTAGSVSAPGSTSGSIAGDVNSSTPQPTSGSPTPTRASGNGGADAPTLSMCAAISVLVAMVAAIL